MLLCVKKNLSEPSTTSVPACHIEVTQVLLMLNQPRPPVMLSTKNRQFPWRMQAHMTQTNWIEMNRDNQQINNNAAPNIWNKLFMNPQRNLQQRLDDISKTFLTSAAMLVPLFGGISELRPQSGQENLGLNNKSQLRYVTLNLATALNRSKSCALPKIARPS